MTLVPIVCLVPMHVAEWITDATDDAWQRMTEHLEDTATLLEEVFAANGWNRRDYVAGSVVGRAYEEATGLEMWPTG